METPIFTTYLSSLEDYYRSKQTYQQDNKGKKKTHLAGVSFQESPETQERVGDSTSSYYPLKITRPHYLKIQQERK